MKKARIMGVYIKHLAEKEGIPNKKLASVLNCTEINVCELYQGLVYPSYDQILELSKMFNVSVSDIVNSDEGLYNHYKTDEFGEFSNNDNREKVLDIIEDYIDLLKSVIL